MNSNTSLEMLSSSLKQEARRNILRASMVFPRTRSIQEEPPSVVTAYYKCNYNRQCDFHSVYQELAKNQDIHAWGLETIVRTIVSDIEQCPTKFRSERVDGFRIKHNGYSNHLLWMKRQDAMPTDGSRTGLLEYSQYRHDVLEAAWTQSIVASVRETSRRQQCTIS